MRCSVISLVLRPLVWLTASLSVLATALAVGSGRHSSAQAATPWPVVPAPHAIAPAAAAKEENPKVAPGLVKWHTSFADAQAASQKSRKPVLLFHMMGQLDKQFC